MLKRPLLIACALFALAACDRQQPQQPQQAQSETQAQPSPPGVPGKGVDRSHKGKSAPDATFHNPDGGETSLAHFRGVPVLVNLWASWCAPCVKELPTLDKVAAAHRDDGQLGVIAVSQDSGPRASVAAFLDKLKVGDLGAYQDSKMALSGALGPGTVLPTTILYDAKGREVWRYVGDLDWTSLEAAKLLAEAGAPAKP